ncbi:Hpt domain protein [Sphingobium chlorophenolicum L-1]|uniref:Hpt domain protein n=1 Tax=Sphingobium chlorophenolicum L-1 TaxID=690566 RepID=F6F3U8_SPHCR|nr:Hpt domain-containing protein [Sphingobium chlorophenolicum]AEG51110.1 Hpt domain protein [Sphingobium chlorophenolicum L-1]
MSTLLDWAKALQNADGDEGLLIELAGVFIDECPEMMRQVRAAIDRRDARELRRAAHSLKGSAHIFAASEAGAAAFRLEEMGADGNFRDVEDGWTLLRFEVEGLLSELIARVGDRNPDETRDTQNS